MEDYPDLVLQLFCDVCDEPFADLDCCADKRKPQLVITKLEKTGVCYECSDDLFGDNWYYTDVDGLNEKICETCYGGGWD